MTDPHASAAPGAPAIGPIWSTSKNNAVKAGSFDIAATPTFAR